MQLEPLGINERCYKMSLEQYRDLRERSFDRYRLAAQILEGDAVNKKPDNQEEKEKNIDIGRCPAYFKTWANIKHIPIA